MIETNDWWITGPLPNTILLPIKMRPSRRAFEKLGFFFGNIVDETFIITTLPSGWTYINTDNLSHFYILDNRGIKRVSAFFYKYSSRGNGSCNLIISTKEPSPYTLLTNYSNNAIVKPKYKFYAVSTHSNIHFSFPRPDILVKNIKTDKIHCLKSLSRSNNFSHVSNSKKNLKIIEDLENEGIIRITGWEGLYDGEEVVEIEELKFIKNLMGY